MSSWQNTSQHRGQNKPQLYVKCNATVRICHHDRFFLSPSFSGTFFLLYFNSTRYTEIIKSDLLRPFRAQVDLTTVAFRYTKFLTSSFSISGRVMPASHKDVSRGYHKPESGSLGEDEWKPHKTNSKHVFHIIVAITRPDSQLFPQLSGALPHHCSRPFTDDSFSLSSIENLYQTPRWYRFATTSSTAWKVHVDHVTKAMYNLFYKQMEKAVTVQANGGSWNHTERWV